MSNGTNTSLVGQAPRFREYSWRELCNRVDPDMNIKANAYEFSNGDTFQATEPNGAFYVP